MISTHANPLVFSPEVQKWGIKKMQEDPEYIQHAARNGSPLVRSIANLVLQIAEQEKKNQ